MKSPPPLPPPPNLSRISSETALLFQKYLPIFLLQRETWLVKPPQGYSPSLEEWIAYAQYQLGEMKEISRKEKALKVIPEDPNES